jgi:hypothetical protein
VHLCFVALWQFRLAFLLTIVGMHVSQSCSPPQVASLQRVSHCRAANALFRLSDDNVPLGRLQGGEEGSIAP